MEHQELARREVRARTEPLVMRQIDRNEFHVHSPSRPDRRYLVVTDPEHLSCSCPDFENHAEDPDWRCKHLIAVLGRNGRGNGGPSAHTVPEARQTPQADPGGTRMMLKRSCSPDGRIDSLSAEFSCPVETDDPTRVAARVRQILSLQAEIVTRFLDSANGRSRDNDRKTQRRSQSGTGTVPAELLGIGGMDTRYGRRLFLNVRSNDRVMKLFGTEKRLADAIEAAGFRDAAEYIEEGIQLNLPCRVATEPSSDGRYVNVTAVYPAAGNGGQP